MYRHFATKQALFEAVVAERLVELTAEADDLLRDEDSGRAFFGFVERLAREGATKRDVVEAFAPSGVELRLGEAASIDGLANAFDPTLRRAQAGGVVRADVDVQDVVAVVSGAAFAISRSDGDETRIRMLLSVLTDGMHPRPLIPTTALTGRRLHPAAARSIPGDAS